MIITRKHPLGGKPLAKGSYQLHSDKQGNFGYLIGYISQENYTGDKILLSLSDAEQFIQSMTLALENFYERNKPKEKIKEKLRRWLIGLLGGVDSSVDNI